MLRRSPIEPFIEKYGMLLLDGALATELEKQGLDLSTDLWSAQSLLDDQDSIKNVHLSYLEAGAKCIISASYQASIKGFMDYGLSEEEAIALLKKSVALAIEARDEFMENRDSELLPLVAASIGPYGAVLADGAEYRGDYEISKSALLEFHEQRWEILAASPSDLLAIETIPSIREAEVILELLQQTPDKFAWVSFSCQDGEHISDGTPIKECVSLFNECDGVVAVGVNCTPPRYISSLIKHIRAGAPGKYIVVYPNSGEVYNADEKSWSGSLEPFECGKDAEIWYKNGAKLIGGCCRLGPEHIKVIQENLSQMHDIA